VEPPKPQQQGVEQVVAGAIGAAGAAGAVEAAGAPGFVEATGSAA
jgi:hypothetical protein